MNFTGYQQKFYNEKSKDKLQTMHWFIAKPPDYCPCHIDLPGPSILAKSWSSIVNAYEAIKQTLGVVPFFYHVNACSLDTPRGIEKVFSRMRTPESLYKSRQKRIRKRLQEKDPLFFNQFIDAALTEDEFDIAFYQTRQKEKQDMILAESAKKEDLGTLWLNPDGQWFTQFDWVSINKELSIQAMKHKEIYSAWEDVIKKFNIYP